MAGLSHENGAEAMHQYTEVKTAWINAGARSGIRSTRGPEVTIIEVNEELLWT